MSNKLKNPIDMTKPLVKPFIDENEALMRFIETVLPHQPRCKIRIHHLYSIDNINKYRINWYEEIDDGLLLKTKLAASRYIQVENTDSGPVVTDKTIIRTV